MHARLRFVSIALWALTILSACGGGGEDAVSPPPSAVVNNEIATTVSTSSDVVVTSGGSQNVSITFNSSDGKPLSQLKVTSDLAAMPEGWSGPKSFSCDAVSAGSSCVLNLQYTPTAVSKGSLTIDYSYTNNAGTVKTASQRIPYYSTANNNVVTTVSPSGQINAVIKVGAQIVTINFATDDGNTASDLVLTTGLGALPAGWSSTVNSFSCATVSAGNGCQLVLVYAPTDVDSGILKLSYSYKDNSRTAKAGSLNIPYAATLDNNVVGTVSPTGQITAVAALGSRDVAVTFTTDDGFEARDFDLTTDLTALPDGWSSPVDHFTCEKVSVGGICQLPLHFAPSIIGTGLITLTYRYTTRAGASRTGALSIPYMSMAQNSVVARTPTNPIVTPNRGTINVPVSFSTDDNGLATGLAITSNLAALPAYWTSASNAFSCANIGGWNYCQLTLTYAPQDANDSGALTLNYTYTDNAGIVRTGSYTINYWASVAKLLVTNSVTNLVSVCPISASGALGACQSTGEGLSGPSDVSVYTFYAEITNKSSNGWTQCYIDVEGEMFLCHGRENLYIQPSSIVVASDGTYAYVSTLGVPGLVSCRAGGLGGDFWACATVSSPYDGVTRGMALSPTDNNKLYVGNAKDNTRAISVLTLLNGQATSVETYSFPGSPIQVEQVVGTNVYGIVPGDGVYRCPIVSTGVDACQSVASIPGAASLTIWQNQAFVSTAAGVDHCSVDSSGSFMGCTSYSDPTFAGTGGLTVY